MVSQKGRAPRGAQALAAHRVCSTHGAAALRWVIRWIFALSAVAFSLCVCELARAHMGSTKTIDAEIRDAGPRLVIQVDAVDASIAIGLGVQSDRARLFEREALLRAWLVRGIGLTSEVGACSLGASELGSGTRDGRATVRAVLDYACPGSGTVTLRDDTVFSDDSSHQTIVTVHEAGRVTTRFLTGGEREMRLRTSPRALETAGHFFSQGIEHLVTGYDHLAFLGSLLLAAALVLAERGARRALREATAVVTAFTLGHSVTLALSGLGVWVLPSRLVESAIALSVVIVAALNLARPSSTAGRPAIAAVFGLIHGFGFSSVLAELGLPAGQRALALASFNIGIEVAQLGFVAVFLPLLGVLARNRGYRALVVTGGSALIAALGSIWFIERALG